MKKIVATLSLCWGLIFTPETRAQISVPEPLPCAKVDLILVFDRSGSLNNGIAQALIDTAVQAFTTTYAVNPETLQVGITTFTDLDPDDERLDEEVRAAVRMVTPVIDITSNPSKLAPASRNLPPASGGTSIAVGLRSAASMFGRHLRANPHRADAKKIVILFTDGISQTETSDIVQADRLLQGTWSEGVLSDAPHLNLPVTIHTIITPEIKTVYDIELVPTGNKTWFWEEEYIPWPHHRILEKKNTGRKIRRAVPPGTDPLGPWHDPDSRPQTEEIDEVMVLAEELEEIRTARSLMNYDEAHLRRLTSPDGFLILLDYETLVADLRRLSRCF